MNASDFLASPSLPGTELPRRGLFLGRAGALLPGAPVAPVARVASVAPVAKGSPLPRVEAALFSGVALGSLFRATQAGWVLYLIGNEEEVAHGSVTDVAWEKFEGELLGFLTGQGIPVKRNYACLEHPQGKGKHRRDSVFLFPNTGALYHAAQEDGIDLGQSWLVSHRTSELAAGWRAGCRTAGVGTCSEPAHGDLHVEPQLRAETLVEALSSILSADTYSRR